MTTAMQVAADPFPPDRVELLRRSICNGFTADEMALFVAQCVRTGLDPFSRQIHATKRRDKKAGVDRLTIQTGIDGFRLIAGRTGELDGQEGPYWCGADGVWRDVWLSNDPPAAAKVIVFRRGCTRGFVGVARFDEYAQRWPDGKLSGLWPKMPGTMIAKCAEALALRKAFPQDLSGLYTSEEMGQADNEPEPEPEPTRGRPVQAKVIDTPTPTAATAPARKALPAPAPAADEPKAMPDTPATLEWLLTEYGRHIDCDAETVLHKLCAAAGWVGICSASDLSPGRIVEACDSLRWKLAGKVAPGAAERLAANGMIPGKAGE